MANDVSYMFFQRDFGDDDNVTRGVYNTHAPIIKNARVVGQNQRLRSGSVPPHSLRAGSVVRTSSSVVSGGGGGSGGVRHGSVPRFAGGASGLSRPFGTSSSSGRRASISVPSGASLHALHGVGGNIASVDANGAVVYKPWFSAAYGPRPSVVVGSTVHQKASVSIPASSSAGLHRRTGIAPSSGGHHHHRYQPEVLYHHTGHIDVEDMGEIARPKISAPVTFDADRQQASLSALRTRTNSAREQLSRHRIMLDRYLPITHGPADNDVAGEVEYKFGELVSRMPQLNQRNVSTRKEIVDNGPVLFVTPYRPAEIKQKPYELPGAPPRNSFTPKVSETRKRARAVLCKVHNDPRYFSY